MQSKGVVWTGALECLTSTLAAWSEPSGSCCLEPQEGTPDWVPQGAPRLCPPHCTGAAVRTCGQSARELLLLLSCESQLFSQPCSEDQ